jgi:hypothetical protein
MRKIKKGRTATVNSYCSLTTEYHKLTFERTNVVTTGEVCHDTIGNLWTKINVK